MPTGAPAYAPASKMHRAWSAVSRPSRVTPVRSSKIEAGAGVVDRNSSERVITTETGRFRIMASAPARGSRSANFAPNPPPMAVATTRSRCSGRPSASATSERVEKSPWVLVQMVSAPSGSTLASAGRGSR
jgi:hypothetical protein